MTTNQTPPVSDADGRALLRAEALRLGQGFIEAARGHAELSKEAIRDAVHAEEGDLVSAPWVLSLRLERSAAVARIASGIPDLHPMLVQSFVELVDADAAAGGTCTDAVEEALADRRALGLLAVLGQELRAAQESSSDAKVTAHLREMEEELDDWLAANDDPECYPALARDVEHAIKELREVVLTGRPPEPQVSTCVRIATVLGVEAMTPKAILSGLEARGWAPNSNNPLGYVSYILQGSKGRFVKAPENRYRVCRDFLRQATSVEARSANSEAPATPGDPDVERNQASDPRGVASSHQSPMGSGSASERAPHTQMEIPMKNAKKSSGQEAAPSARPLPAKAPQATEATASSSHRPLPTPLVIVASNGRATETPNGTPTSTTPNEVTAISEAEKWREALWSALDAKDWTGGDRGYLMNGQQRALWKQLTDDGGRPFKRFDAFLAAARPLGLGDRSLDEVNAVLHKSAERTPAKAASADKPKDVSASVASRTKATQDRGTTADTADSSDVSKSPNDGGAEPSAEECFRACCKRIKILSNVLLRAREECVAKTAWEQMHPETRQGGAPGKRGGGKAKTGTVPGFVLAIANEVGCSESMVFKDVKLWTSLDSTVRDVLIETKAAAHTRDLYQCARLPREKQRAVVEAWDKDDIKTFRALIDQRLPPKSVVTKTVSKKSVEFILAKLLAPKIKVKLLALLTSEGSAADVREALVELLAASNAELANGTAMSVPSREEGVLGGEVEEGCPCGTEVGVVRGRTTQPC